MNYDDNDNDNDNNNDDDDDDDDDDGHGQSKSKSKSTQGNACLQTRTYARTCKGWPNGFVSRLASSRKSEKAINFTHNDTQTTCDQLERVELRWAAKRLRT